MTGGDGDNGLINDRRDFIAAEAKAEPMPDKRLADIGAALTITSGPTIAHELYDEVQRARAAVAEMTRCRDNAMAYAERQHVSIELDDEIDTDGETLTDRIEGELLGPGWDWEDDRTPGLLARTAVAVIRPHLARLTDQAQKARARLAEIGELRKEWRFDDGMGKFTVKLTPLSDADVRYLQQQTGRPVEHRVVGEWKAADDG